MHFNESILTIKKQIIDHNKTNYAPNKHLFFVNEQLKVY